MSSILKVDQLQDSGGNNLVTSNGSGVITSAGFGKVAQVLEGTTTTEFLVSTPTDNQLYYPSSNKLTVSITPNSTSSKILVTYISTIRVKRLSSGSGDTGGGMVLKETIDGTSTDIKPDDTAFSSGIYITNFSANANIRARLSEHMLRSPSTTSEITYEVGIMGYHAQEVRFNDDNGNARIQVMEILP